MKDSFQLNKLEHTKEGKKIRVKGRAVVANKELLSSFTKNKTSSFRELFTTSCIEKIYSQMKYRPIFVDALHSTNSILSNESILSEMKENHPELNDQILVLEQNIKRMKIPMWKLENFTLDDEGIGVQIESNPLFAEVDEEHNKYYEAIVGSVEGGFINGISMNFITKDTCFENGIQKINDVDIYGLSLTDGPAYGAYSAIEEVAMRSMKGTEKEETKMAENTEIKEKIVEKVVEKLPVDFDKIVAEKVSSLMKEKEIESQHKSQEEEHIRLKSELEQLKKEKESGSKGTVRDETKIDETRLIESIRNLSLGDVIRLQAEMGGKIPILVPEASHQGQHNDPRVTWTFKPLPGSWSDKFNHIVNANSPSEMSFGKISRN